MGATTTTTSTDTATTKIDLKDAAAITTNKHSPHSNGRNATPANGGEEHGGDGGSDGDVVMIRVALAEEEEFDDIDMGGTDEVDALGNTSSVDSGVSGGDGPLSYGIVLSKYSAEKSDCVSGDAKVEEEKVSSSSDDADKGGKMSHGSDTDKGGKVSHSRDTDKGGKVSQSSDADKGGKMSHSSDTDKGGKVSHSSDTDKGGRVSHSSDADKGGKVSQSSDADKGGKVLHSSDTDKGGKVSHSSDADKGRKMSQSIDADKGGKVSHSNGSDKGRNVPNINDKNEAAEETIKVVKDELVTAANFLRHNATTSNSEGSTCEGEESLTKHATNKLDGEKITPVVVVPKLEFEIVDIKEIPDCSDSSPNNSNCGSPKRGNVTSFSSEEGSISENSSEVLSSVDGSPIKSVSSEDYQSRDPSRTCSPFMTAEDKVVAVVPPIQIIVTAATPVKTYKPFLSRDKSSVSSSASKETRDNETIKETHCQAENKTPNCQIATRKPGRNNVDDASFEDEVISIELQRETSIKSQNKFNVTISKDDFVNVDVAKTTADCKDLLEDERGEHVVNIRKEIEKLNRRLDESKSSPLRNSSSQNTRNSNVSAIRSSFASAESSNKDHPPYKRRSLTDEDVVNANVCKPSISSSLPGHSPSKSPTVSNSDNIRTTVVFPATSTIIPNYNGSAGEGNYCSDQVAVQHDASLTHPREDHQHKHPPSAVSDEGAPQTAEATQTTQVRQHHDKRTRDVSPITSNGLRTTPKSDNLKEFPMVTAPLQVQPSTESYLTPCKELVESSERVLAAEGQSKPGSKKNNSNTKNNHYLNPFGDSDDNNDEDDDPYDESDDEPITVIHSTPKQSVAPKTRLTVVSTNPFEDDDTRDENDEEVAVATLNRPSSSSSSNSSNPDVSRVVPSPLPRTSLMSSTSLSFTPVPVPRPRTTLSGSSQSINTTATTPRNQGYRNGSGAGGFSLRSPLNVSTMSTKSLNPFEESEEDDSDYRINGGGGATEGKLGSKKKIGGSQYSLRGDISSGGGDFTRNPYRGSLPARRRKRRAPLPPGMQAPTPSPAHGPLTSTTSVSVHSPTSAETVGLAAHHTSARRATWGNAGSTPRKPPPPRPPPPSPMAVRLAGYKL